MNNYDLLIIGSGPVGLAAALEAKRKGLNAIILEKGVLCNSLYHFPSFMRFFTTAELLEIGGHAFPSTDIKPTRQRALDYYRRVTQLNRIDVRLHHKVESIIKNDIFTISGTSSIKGDINKFEFHSENVIIATGYFDNPVGLGGIPGEDLSHVSYYYSEPHGFYKHDVVVIGAGNSGAETALELYRHGANVTIIHKYEEPKSSLKYWVGPDLKNRIKNKEINSVMPAITKKIDEKGVFVLHNNEELFIPADHVFILTGFTPDMEMLQKFGIEFDNDTLACDLSDVYESSIPGMYLVGSVGFGRATNSVFIENGREHAVIAVNDIAKLNKTNN